MSWIEVRAEFGDVLDTSLLVEAYRDHGVENTLEDGACLVGCVVAAPGHEKVVEALTHALMKAGATDVKTQLLPEQNWDELWRKHFKPHRIGSRLVVRPSWETYEFSPGDIELVLDPGQAFGTGEHATTKMCLELLEAADLAGKSVLDLGCGSGILAIAAVKMGASRVLAVDIDPMAVEVAKENARLNGVTVPVLQGDGEMGNEQVDIIVSNIISATLIRLAGLAYERLKSGGWWQVSGIISDNWPDVLDEARRVGFTLDRTIEEDGWVAAQFSKR